MKTYRFDDSALEQIREKIDPYEVVSPYVVLKKKGREMLGLCPFHNESTPSFSVNQEKKTFYCFGCQEGGDTISFLMKMESKSFSEVVLDLAQKYNVPVKSTDPEEAKALRQEYSLKRKLLEVTAIAQKFFQSCLSEPRGRLAQNYLLSERGISPETIQNFSIGYAPAGWNNLCNHLESKGYSLEIAEKAGLVKLDKAKPYDIFRNRVVFPIRNKAGESIGFGARTLSTTEGIAKYINTSETLIFDKSKNLFGLHRAKSSISRNDQVTIVEGYLDAIALHSKGLTNAVACLGTAVTDAQIKLASSFTKSKQIVLNLDSDASGVKAVNKTIEKILPLIVNGEVDLKVLILPNGEKDADVFLRSNSPQDYQALADSCPSWIDWKIETTIEGYDTGDPSGFINASKEIIALINEIPDLNTKQYCLAKSAEMLAGGDNKRTASYYKNLSVQLEQSSLPRQRTRPRKQQIDTRPNLAPTEAETPLAVAENLILHLFIRYPSYRQEIVAHFDDKDLQFSFSSNREIWQYLLEVTDSNMEVPPSILQESLGDNYQLMKCLHHLLASAREETISAIAKSAILTLEKIYVNKKCETLLAKWKESQSQKDTVTASRYYGMYVNTRERISEVEAEKRQLPNFIKQVEETYA